MLIARAFLQRPCWSEPSADGIYRDPLTNGGTDGCAALRSAERALVPVERAAWGEEVMIMSRRYTCGLGGAA